MPHLLPRPVPLFGFHTRWRIASGPSAISAFAAKNRRCSFEDGVFFVKIQKII
jgi:hypothetical protein